MMTIKRYITLSLLQFATLVAFAAFDDYLITQETQVAGLTGLTANTLDPEGESPSEAKLSKNADGVYSFEVKLETPISLTEDEGLVVMFGRWNDKGSGSPKATQVEGINENGGKDILGYSYMQFRGGNGTIEYSKPLYGNVMTIGHKYKTLIFTVLKTALGYDENGDVSFNKFNVFMLKRGDLYPDGRIDPWRLNTDYYNTYHDFKFEPTKGILDERNHFRTKEVGPWSAYDGKIEVEEYTSYPTATPWGENNKFSWGDHEYTLPTFEMGGANTQMPHVTEHTVYAMPGEIIPLQPFYEMPVNPSYLVRFAHWYQYKPNDAEGNPVAQDFSHVYGKNGERLLDFLIDPARIALSDNYGYYAGGESYLPLYDRSEDNGNGGETGEEDDDDDNEGDNEGDEEIKENLYVIRKINGEEDSFEKFSELVNGDYPDLNAILVDDLNFGGVDAITIGTSEKPYSGHFNGNGHTIRNMSIIGNGNSVGLFNYVSVGASISNINLDNFTVSNSGDTGLLIGHVGGGSGIVSINNVMISGTIEMNGSGHGGGVIGNVGDNVDLELLNVAFKGSILGKNESAAFIGMGNRYTASKFRIKNCYADAYLEKYRVDSDGNLALPVVGIPENNLELSNNIFNVISYSDRYPNVKVYATQSGLNSFNGYNVSIETKDRKDNSNSIKILVEKGEWTDFVLYWKSEWETPNYVVGYKRITTEEGKKDDIINAEDGKKYVYFDLNVNEWAKYSYAIVPYKGESELDANTFDWNLTGLGIACQCDDYKNRTQDEYVHFSPVEFNTSLSSIEPFDSWDVIENSDCRIPPMKVLSEEEEDALKTYIYIPPVVEDPTPENPNPNDPTGEETGKYVSHPDVLIWDGFEHPWYGTVATFFQPFDTSLSPTDEENLKLDKSEYYIAADFSHQFAPYAKYNLDEEKKEIYSPIINFRHVFHVVSGKDFADNNTSSKDVNDKYLRTKRRVISAIAGKDFQVRLPSEFPVPTDDNIYSATNFYYKSVDGYYDRARGFRIEVTDKDGNEYNDLFNFSNDESIVTLDHYIRSTPPANAWEPTEIKQDEFLIAQQGTRRYEKEGAVYHTAGGEGLVHRMLECKGEKIKENTQNTYIVRLIALDDAGKDAKMADGNTAYMMEYEITFLPQSEASFETDTELKKHNIENADDDDLARHKDEYLQQKDVCGDPVAFLNFDEYKYFEQEGMNQDDYFLFMGREYYVDKDGYEKEKYWFNPAAEDLKGPKSFKWPTEWSQCSYSFGYGDYMLYDYNEYQIANHSSQVHHSAYANDNITNADGSKGLYDRLYYDTYDAVHPEKTEKGFFYYVNAASDPGVTSRLQLKNLCMGSTVVVTAWVSEFTYKPGESEEQANVAFNFSAVMKDKSRVRLHSFITGYVTEPGQWYHVYYSFVPEVPEEIEMEDIDHYELELENNCRSSKGADYAIDDIRMYVVTPKVTATQLRPLCDENVKSMGVKLSTRFDRLLETQGLSKNEGDDGIPCNLYVAIFDKNKYDTFVADYNYSFEDALKESVVLQETGEIDENGHLILDEKEDPIRREWVSVDGMNTNFSKLLEFDPGKPEQYFYTAMGEVGDNGLEYIDINVTPYDNPDMHVGKQYYVCLHLVDGRIDPKPEVSLANFSISESECAKYGIITLKGSGVVKVDGYAFADDESIEVCYGQAPVLQVDLMKVGTDGNVSISEDKFYYDWFFGTSEEFSEYIDPSAAKPESVFSLLTKFRIDYPDATEIPVADYRVSGFEDMDEASYNALVVQYKDLAEKVRIGDLVLHKSSLVFPTLVRGNDFIHDDVDTGEGEIVVTAMPIIRKDDLKLGEQICSQPNEIKLKVVKSTPKMHDGIASIEYPVGMEDVPLRVGLRQLRDVSTSVTAIPDNFTRRLQVPLRALASHKGGDAAVEMRMRDKIADKDGKEKDVDPFVYIVETNDPVYKGLTEHPGSDLTDPDLKLHLDKEFGVLEGLLPVGKVTGLTAVKGRDGNAVNMVFTKDMKFREGYYYKLRFDFNEVLPEEEGKDVCAGQVIFTIKVVPEYQQWTGDAGRNWNNDENWRRVVKSELFLGDADTEIGTEKVAATDHTSDGGNNANRLSYAPMDFTKVIIPTDVKNFPLMFERTLTDVNTLQGSRKWDNKDADASASHHGATKDIKYDMASLALDNVLACRPWYANTCEEIHFEYGAELQRQQWFAFGDNYKKAWVDLVTVPNRWYTLATPLKQVVAGDMYTISDGAKQNTELFRDITFNNADYGRYDPAVYQRSWNKDGIAQVFSYGDNSNAYVDAADRITLNWSHTYNQVDVNYSGGEGFSINTRYIGENDENNDNTDNAEKTDNSVRFRLPKADDSYSYFTPDDKTESADDKAIAKRTERHSLNAFPLTATLTAKEESKYFLVGNPFIAQMDMEAFFKGNTNLSGKYWIMSGDRQTAYLWNGSDEKFISTADGDEGKTVATMQGFFVEANTATKNLSVTFTADMIKVTDGAGSAGPLKVAAQNTYANPLLSISAIVGDEEASRTVINLSADAKEAYDSAEDAVMLFDPSQKVRSAVFTVGGGHTLAINSLDRIVQTEIGVAADSDVMTTLLFEGIDEAEGLKLLDTATGEFSDLFDGMTYEVEGAAVGRLYLVSGDSDLSGADVAVLLDGRAVGVMSSADGIVARAYDALGVCLGEWNADGPTLNFDLTPGIRLVEVINGSRKITRKFVVK